MHTKEKNLIRLIQLAIHHKINIGTNEEDFYLWFIGAKDDTEYKNSSSNYEDLLSEKQLKKEISIIYKNSPEPIYGNEVKGEVHYEVALFFVEGEESGQKDIRFYFKEVKDFEKLLMKFNSVFEKSFYKIERWVCFKRYERGGLDRLESAEPILYKELNKILEPFKDKKGSRFDSLQRRLSILKKINDFKHTASVQIKFGLIYKVLILIVLMIGFYNFSYFKLMILTPILIGLLLSHNSAVKHQSMKSFVKELKNFCKKSD